jgi:hypothetical protein
MKEVRKMGRQELEKIQLALRQNFDAIVKAQNEIKNKLIVYSDGKNLKGDEIVGWLGEIYAKILFDGKLVEDSNEHDVETKNGMKISVKTRKGFGNGWNKTGAIPKIEGSDCPTHLMFVHLNDDYSIERIWLYPWEELLQAGRFKVHMVRGNKRSFIFRVSVRTDEKYLIYRGK